MPANLTMSPADMINRKRRPIDEDPLRLDRSQEPSRPLHCAETLRTILLCKYQNLSMIESKCVPCGDFQRGLVVMIYCKFDTDYFPTRTVETYRIILD